MKFQVQYQARVMGGPKYGVVSVPTRSQADSIVSVGLASGSFCEAEVRVVWEPGDRAEILTGKHSGKVITIPDTYDGGSAVSVHIPGDADHHIVFAVADLIPVEAR